ncbi:MAG: dehydrogenase [Rhodothermales bacterium]|nr:dehydrogenase [Rhodothermales bacterium]
MSRESASTSAGQKTPASTGVSEAFDRTGLSPESLYEAMLLPRLIEEKMLRLIRQNRLAKWFSGYGQEAIAVGTALALEEDDWILPMHRNLGVWTTREVPLRQLFCQLMGKAGGFTNGRDRTFHFGLPGKRIVGMISHLAAMLPVADGLALGSVLDGRPVAAAAFVGEGATREGDFHEALNLAAVWKLPVIFVVENNRYGLSTPVEDVIAVEDLADAGSGYGMAADTVDGNDVFDVFRAVRGARTRAIAGDGPTLLEMKTFRVRGHEEASGTRYVPDELIADWEKKDPLRRLEDRLGDVLDAGRRQEIRERLTRDVEEVAEWAIGQPAESSTAEAELSDVYAAPPDAASTPADNGEVADVSPDVRFIDAISDGLRTAMREDDRTLILGQDVAEYGGVFKVTAGFLEEFGAARVRNTPIIESGAVGAAMGLALAGYRPVLEIQYADFISCGFNQIVNNLATTRYRWGAPLNVTIRAPFGGGIGAGPFHSQSIEAWFCHVPGLKVVVPATPEDAKGLMLSAIDDPNPVLLFEHKKLYRSVRGSVPREAVRIPIGRARIALGGSDATIVTWGVGLHWALEEAERRTTDGVRIEVIDLRSLVPWDRETVRQSVGRTNRLLVLHEATRTAGFGAEVAARIVEECFEDLDAPPVRVGGADMPVPFSASLESDIYSARSRLSDALDRLLAW